MSCRNTKWAPTTINLSDNQQDSLDGGSAHGENNAAAQHIDYIHAWVGGIWTQDLTVREVDDSAATLIK